MKKYFFILTLVLSQLTFGQWIVTDYNNIDSLGTFYGSGKLNFYFKTSVTNGQAAVSYQKILSSGKTLNDDIVFVKAKISGGEAHALFRSYHDLNPAVNSNITTLIPTGNADIYTFLMPSGIIHVNRIEMRFGYFPYTFGVRNIQVDSIWTSNGVVLESPGGVTSVNDPSGSLPTEFSLEQNYPNPFNPSTKISFSIPEKSNVSLKVYDVLGNEVTNLVEGDFLAGAHEVNFNASKLASGIYFYVLKAGSFSQTKKMNLLK